MFLVDMILETTINFSFTVLSSLVAHFVVLNAFILMVAFSLNLHSSFLCLLH